MSQPNRMESARRRVQITRYVIGVVAAGAFAGGAVVARAAHPGTHGHHSTSAEAAIPSESSALAAAAQSSGSGSTNSDDNSSSSSSSSSGSSVSPAPAASPPVVQSSGS